MELFKKISSCLLILFLVLDTQGQYNGPQSGWGGGGGRPPPGYGPGPSGPGPYGSGPGGPGGPPKEGPYGNGPSPYGKPPSGGPGGPGSTLSNLAGLLPSALNPNNGNNGPSGYSNAYNDDPIPPMPQGESSYDTQKLPAHLPILAPNGVVEIYNRVVDDLIKRLAVDFKKRGIEPMEIVIRPTPAGPVRVPGYLQRRPFRRPGAALYRAANGPLDNGSQMLPSPAHSIHPQMNQQLPKVKRSRAIVEPSASPVEEAAAAVDEASASIRGAGKISKTPLNHEENQETTTESSSPPAAVESNSTTTTTTETKTEEPDSPEEQSSEEISFFRARSGEYLIGGVDNDEDDDDDMDMRKENNKKEVARERDDTLEENDDEDEDKVVKNSKKNVDALITKYQNKNTKGKKGVKEEILKSGSSNSESSSSNKKNKNKDKVSEDKDEDEKEGKGSSDEGEDDEEDDDDEVFPRDDILGYDGPGREPGTFGERPPGSGGYYPQGGPPAVPSKPNAVMSGLSKMRRSSDVSVSVDARSAIITARLLVGPINVVINDSSEPLERNVRATIPELEAELLLMERHGVVFLQRFTLDRAYGQDVEISIPKPKSSDKNKKKQQLAAGGPQDPNHPLYRGGYDRYKTKMAAHISMEVVKMLRSGNLRVNLMRTAQTSMSKLRLPIQKEKKVIKKTVTKSKARTSNKNKKNKERRN